MTTATLDRVPVEVSMHPEEAPGVAKQSLAATLSHLDISVMLTEQVEAFKRRHVRKEKMKNGIVGSGIIIAVFLLGGALFYTGVVLSLRLAVLELLATLCLVLVGSLLLIFSITMAGALFHEVSRLGWQKTMITGSVNSNSWSWQFNEFNIPTGALEDVRRIGQELPGASFAVHHIPDDPFLQVLFGEESYFIHHWDEEFEES